MDNCFENDSFDKPRKMPSWKKLYLFRKIVKNNKNQIFTPPPHLKIIPFFIRLKKGRLSTMPTAPWRHPGATRKAPRRHPGATRKAPGRYSGATRALPGRHLGATLTAPWRHSGAIAKLTINHEVSPQYEYQFSLHTLFTELFGMAEDWLHRSVWI